MKYYKLMPKDALAVAIKMVEDSDNSEFLDIISTGPKTVRVKVTQHNILVIANNLAAVISPDVASIVFGDSVLKQSTEILSEKEFTMLGAAYCPYCLSEFNHYSGIDIMENTAYQRSICGECGRAVDSRYRLDGYMIT